MRESFAWVLEAVRDSTIGWLNYLAIGLFNAAVTVNLTKVIFGTDDKNTLILAVTQFLLVVWIVTSALRAVEPARGLSATLTLKAHANAARDVQRYTEGIGRIIESDNARITAEYMENIYTNDADTREFLRGTGKYADKKTKDIN